MKRICYIVLVLIIMPLLVSCVTDPETYYFNADDIVEKIIKIELVNSTNENPKNVIVDNDTILSFNMQNTTFIKELDKNKIEDFVRELSTITFHIGDKSVNSPLGYTLILYMENQEIIVLSCTVLNGTAYGMVAVFTPEGNFINHIAEFADEPKFRKLLEKYFDV